jgi:DNA/RNA-binding domain of Phe-tRNA-synthetase-like protein
LSGETPLAVDVPDGHPLRAGAFITTFESPLGAVSSPEWLTALLRDDADAPMTRDEAVRTAVRDMLRRAGYKPTGRGKPASEYLVRAAGEDTLASINVAVDACNAVSLHSGLPISAVDLDRAEGALRIAIAAAGESFVFNASGQEIDLAGLVCVYDGAGPCANAVKDSQRTKTNERTTRTLSVVWGCAGHEQRLAEAVDWYRSLLLRAGARTAGGPVNGTGERDR